MTSAEALTERRQHPRSEVAATAVVLTANGYSGQYLVENLSAGGALLVGDARLQPGERLKVLLHLPGQPMRISAEVLRRQGYGAEECLFPVAFRDLSPEVEDTLQEVVLATLEGLREASRQEVLVIDDSREVRRAISAPASNDARHIDTAISPSSGGSSW